MNSRRKRKKQFQQDNRGVTLMEMVVSVAIIGIFAAVVAGFVTSGANFYRKSADTVQVQSDMQNTLESIENLILDTNVGISYAADDQTRTLTLHCRKLVATGQDEAYVDTIMWNVGEEKLYYTRTGSGSLAIATMVLADGVTDFQADVSQVKSQGVVRFSLTMNRRGKEEAQEYTVTLRNRLDVAVRDDGYRCSGYKEAVPV